MTDREQVSALLKAAASPRREWAEELGHKMFTMYSQGGFPPDMFISELAKRHPDLDQDTKVQMLTTYLHDTLNHKRTAGLSEERVDKIRAQNTRILDRFLTTGEMGIY